MLDLSTAVLCDFAQVRDRLLFVSSGAVSRLYRQELPSPLGLMVGLVIEVPLEDAGMEHQLRAEVINRHGTVLATLENTFRVSDAGLFPHEVQQVPLVLSITGVRARTWGTHQVRLYLDNELVRALTLYVVPATGPQTAVRTPTQSRVDDAEGTVAGGGPEGAPIPGPEPGPGDDQGRPPEDEPQPDRGDEKVVVLDEDPLADLDAPIVVGDPAPVDDLPAPEPDAPAPPVSPVAEPLVAAAPPADLPPPPPAAPVVAAPPPPAPEEAVDWGGGPAAPAPSESRSEPVAPPAAPPPRLAPVIDAPPATEPRVFDFDEDDLDADPAQRPPEGREQDDASRFSFRYLEDDS